MTMSLGKKIIHVAIIAALFCAAVIGFRLWYGAWGETRTTQEGSSLGFALLSLLYKISAEPATVQAKPPLSGKMVLADLPKRTITLYEDGVVQRTIPIVSIGKPGTAWETPAGNYEILTKENLHFSSLGNVWMPYSMQFFGNFFVHGWPYYPDGTPVATGYSGGCIRLATIDAQALYEFASIGTPLRVLGGEGVSTKESMAGSSYYLTNGGDRPDISGAAYVAADAETGAILFARNATALHTSESTARLMAGLVSVEVVNQFAPLRTTFSSGEADMVLGDDIIALLLNGNESAVAAFRARAGEKRFDGAMEGKARAMGLAQSAFIGEPLSATTTAKDMSIFARYLYRNKQYFFNKTKAASELVRGEGEVEEEVIYPRITVGGTGVYRGGVIAGRDGVVLVDLPLSEFEPRPITISVLASNDPARDLEALVEFTRTHFAYRPERSLLRGVLSSNGGNALTQALKYLQSAALAYELKKEEGLREGEPRSIMSP